MCEGHGGRRRDLESLEKEMDCGVEDVCVERIGRGFGWVYLGGEKRWVVVYSSFTFFSCYYSWKAS